MKRPLLAIVGRANAGKSTLFNRLVGRQKAIVHDMPGVTRDRLYSDAHAAGTEFGIVDTGGLEVFGPGVLVEDVQKQVRAAIAEADGVVLLVDGREPLTAADEAMAQWVRESGKPAIVAVNKIDGPRWESGVHDAWRLGFKDLFAISAQEGHGVEAALGKLLSACTGAPLDPRFRGDDTGVDSARVARAEGGPGPERMRGSRDERVPGPAADDDDEPVARRRKLDDPPPAVIHIAVVGKPNVGKSTLVNRLIGQERSIVSDLAGTTRDAIDTAIKYKERDLVLVDTAGIRRKRSVHEDVEYYAVHRALRAIDRAHVAVLVLDASQPVSEQDAKIAGYIQDAGRPVVIVANKWDLIKSAKSIQAYRREALSEIEFMAWAPLITVSGKTGQRVFTILDTALKVFGNARKVVPTAEFNRFLEWVQQRHNPPVFQGHRVKFFFGAQTAVAPPEFAIKCNYPAGVHFSYRRFVTNEMRAAFGYDGTPLKLVFAERRRSPSKNLQKPTKQGAQSRRVKAKAKRRPR